MLSHPSRALVRAMQGWDQQAQGVRASFSPPAAKLPTDTGLISQRSQDLFFFLSSFKERKEHFAMTFFVP